ncbi:MAG: DUF2949 domain-containing protein [Chlorogloea purpurea SAG 13.99]|nr:DUF2949 domain-containing protein [Chlorogloea purpurea SAG 13.99]
MSSTNYSLFVSFLQDELSLSRESIAMAERSGEADKSYLPMVLWKYGLVTLEELNQIYDFLERVI